MTTVTPAAVAADAPKTGSWLGGRWMRFALRRAARLLVSLWVLVTAAFFMIRAVPGDPVRAALGITAPPDLVAAKRAEFGLDDPLWKQYVHYLNNLVHGDLGTSFVTQLPVRQMVSQRLPATAELAVAAFVVAVLIAIPVGLAIAAATRRGRGRRTEVVFAGTSVVLGTIPDFFLGVGLVYIFGVSMHALPVAGRDGFTSFVLPVVSLAIGPAAVLARIVRVEVLAVLETDYIRTARAKRIRPFRIYLAHALPNAVTATLTIGGLLLGSLVAGTVLVENVFAWPGLGSTIVSSITAKDFPMVQATVLVYGVGVLLINTVVDVALAILDPRSAIGDL